MRMHRLTLFMSLAGVLATCSASRGDEHASSSVSGATGASGTITSSRPSTEANARGAAEVKANAREVKANARKDARARAAPSATEHAQARASVRLDVSAQKIDNEARVNENRVAERMAAEFGTSTEGVLLQKDALEASWGNLVIAYTLAASPTTETTVEQLVRMRQGGVSWGQIAAGLELDIPSVVSAVRAEERVMNGSAKADGQVALIRNRDANANASAGAHAGVEGRNGRSIGAGVGSGASVNTNTDHGVSVGAEVGSGVGAGVKIGR